MILSRLFTFFFFFEHLNYCHCDTETQLLFSTFLLSRLFYKTLQMLWRNPEPLISWMRYEMPTQLTISLSSYKHMLYVIHLYLLCIRFQLEPLAYRRMDFEEFRAATISPYQLEALSRWEEIAGTAFEYFEQEGNRPITIEELAQVCNRNVLRIDSNIWFCETLIECPFSAYRRWIFLPRRILSSVTGLDRLMASLAF